MSKKMKIISLLVIIVTIFSILPQSLPVLAASTPSNTYLDNKVQEKPADIIGEVNSMRTLDTKYFFRSDHSTTAAIYPYPVHYMKDGLLTDIDNTLVVKTDTDNEQVLENSANAFSVKFAQKAKQNKLVLC